MGRLVLPLGIFLAMGFLLGFVLLYETTPKSQASKKKAKESTTGDEDVKVVSDSTTAIYIALVLAAAGALFQALIKQPEWVAHVLMVAGLVVSFLGGTTKFTFYGVELEVKAYLPVLGGLNHRGAQLLHRRGRRLPLRALPHLHCGPAHVHSGRHQRYGGVREHDRLHLHPKKYGGLGGRHPVELHQLRAGLHLRRLHHRAAHLQVHPLYLAQAHLRGVGPVRGPGLIHQGLLLVRPSCPCKHPRSSPPPLPSLGRGTPHSPIGAIPWKQSTWSWTPS